MADHNPKWDKLIPAGGDALRLPDSRVSIDIPYEIGKPGSDEVDYTYVYRLFNRYKWERVVARDQHNLAREEATGNSRGAAPNQQFEYRKTTYQRWAYVLFQKYELWRTDMTLDAYYNFVTGAKLGIPAGAYGTYKTGSTIAKLAKTAPTRVPRYLGRASGLSRMLGLGVSSSSGVAGTAATAATASAASTIMVGLADAAAAFVLVTYVMAWTVPSSRMENSGWFPVTGDWETFEFKPGDVQIRYEDKIEKRDTIWR